MSDNNTTETNHTKLLLSIAGKKCCMYCGSIIEEEELEK